PAAKLGEGTQLGWSSWIGRDRPLQAQAAVSGMLYEPEMYSESRARA
ncbi:MAG: type VI secretion system baseplate subunit TssG, partial [Burkholderiaceae bacterium]